MEKHIAEKWDHTLVSLILRFRGAYAYVDVQDPTHLCRLGFLGDLDHWGFAFYKYSDDVYEKSRDWDGSFITTPERAFDVAAWETKRNASEAKIKWQFTTKDARIKLHTLYPSL
ncbi:MAG: hypothetical protein NT025_09865 [bacterium]|nr:hypothetical protein [bacterium]